MSTKDLEKQALEAEQVLVDNIALPAFADRLDGHHGIKWANEQEFATLHAMGTQLYQQHVEQQQTPSSDVNPFLKAAYEQLAGQPAPVNEDAQILAAATRCVESEASIKQAALDYFNYFNQLQADAA